MLHYQLALRSLAVKERSHLLPYLTPTYNYLLIAVVWLVYVLRDDVTTCCSCCCSHA
jgi:hypothetical protein